LGQHSPNVLPSVDELIDLIADVEVRTFASPTAVEDELLRTGWYLHGVASAVAAGELYTLARQQRAFAVSAHIFDLASNQADRLVHDRLTLSFAAQVGYRRAGLDPNATAIWRRVDGLLEWTSASGAGELDATDEPLSSADRVSTLSLRAGIAFLGLDVARTGKLLATWRTEIAALTELVGSDTLLTTMFGPVVALTDGITDLLTFLRYGDRDRLDTARDALISVVDLTAGRGDHDARWVAAHLLAIADEMGSSSIWSALPDGTPPEVAQAFTIGAPPILTLWPPQRELLTRAVTNPLDPAVRRVLLSVPTSAGKTLVAQILISHHVATQSGNVCYVTPLRSLGREMRQALSGRLRILAKGMGADLPDYGDMSAEDFFDLLEEPEESSVDVMTPERLAHLLRQDPESVLSRYSMFVVDEAHLLAQPGRGFLLESILSVLTRADARLVLLSGVMGNAQQIAAWLDPSEPEALFSSVWRGPRRLHALLYSHVVWKREEQVTPKSKAFSSITRYPIVGDLRVRPAEGKVHRLGTSIDEPIGELTRSQRPDGTSKRESTPFYRMCARTAHALLPAGSLLMVLSRRDYARNSAQELAALLPFYPRSELLVEFLRERLGEEHPLVDCVRHGVAYHHAGLPVDVLDELEQAMRAEVLLAICATSTLTDGVNLPVRTVLISETRYEGQDPGQQLDAPRLLNAVGRAGRAGRETEGWIVLALNEQPNNQQFERLRPADDDLEIRSTLASEVALQRLAEAEALMAATADALFELASGEAADFASFVWFVLSASERLGTLAPSVDLHGAVAGLLAFVQLPDDIRARWIGLANQVRARYLTTPAESRLRWTLTGTGLRSARRIERIATMLADEITKQFGERRNYGPVPGPVATVLTIEQSLDMIESSGTLKQLLELPEAGNVWRFRPSVGSKNTVDVPVTPAMRDWISGLSMPVLAAVMLPTVPDASWRLEQTVDAVSGAFEHFLSWTVHVVARQANELLVEQGGVAAIPDTLAYYIRYGVDTLAALNLLTAGVRSRRIAHEVGRQALAEGIEWPGVRNWLRELHIPGWRGRFGATRREIEDLAEFCRSRSKSPLRRLLESGEAAVDLAVPMSDSPTSPLRVELRATAPEEPVEVWAMTPWDYQIGIVTAAWHADAQLLLASGIAFTASTDGAVVTLREPR